MPPFGASKGGGFFGKGPGKNESGGGTSRHRGKPQKTAGRSISRNTRAKGSHHKGGGGANGGHGDKWD